MTATLPEQIRTFHITGHGLPGASGPFLATDFEGTPLPPEPADLNADSAVVLAIETLLESRREARAHFQAQVRQLAERLDDLLALDASNAGDAATAGNLGAAAAQFFHVENLAAVLRRRANPMLRMMPERRARCEHALSTLRQAMAIVHPPYTLFHHPGPVPNPLGGEAHASADPCAAAVQHAQNQMQAMTSTLQALRIARLELEDAYDPEVHDPILQRFRWEAASQEELAAQSPVIAVLSAAQAAECPLGSFARLLQSGCPVLLVIPHSAASNEPGSLTADLAMAAVALRQAFVLQSSLAAPEHLRAGLAELAKAPLPAIAVIATPAKGSWPESVILAQVRAWALFSYNPAASLEFRECLRLERPPSNTWTAAHAAALNPVLAHHFRRLPADTESADLMEMSDYLRQYERRAPLAVPYLRLRNGERAAVSRDIAEYCHDRMEACRLLEQWAAAPATPAAAAPAAPDTTAQARREGAQAAYAQVLAILTKEGGKP